MVISLLRKKAGEKRREKGKNIFEEEGKKSRAPFYNMIIG